MVGAQDIFLNPLIWGERILRNLLFSNLRREMWVRFLFHGWLDIKIFAHMVGLVRYLNRHTHSLDSFGSFVGVVRSFDNKIVHSSFVRSILGGFYHMWCGSNILKS